jgi:hypothetical protein
MRQNPVAVKSPPTFDTPRWRSYHAPTVTPGDSELFALCSTCRKAIAVGARYWRCSVTNCNMGRVKLVFCSSRCWEGHLPTARHRKATSVEEIARRG